MCSALILAFLLGSASAKGYNRSNTKLAIPKQDIGSPPADRGPSARIVGGAPPLTMRAPACGLIGVGVDVVVTSSVPLSARCLTHRAAPQALLSRRSSTTGSWGFERFERAALCAAPRSSTSSGP